MNVIYHHTDINGLIGIISTKKLWATDIHFLNDFKEFQHGLVSLDEICIHYLSQEYKDYDANFVNIYKKLLVHIQESIPINLNRRNHYLTSFTKSNDNLRQWMAYGSPNMSYAIGFKEDLLRVPKLGVDKMASENFAYKLIEVDYNLNSLKKLLEISNILKMTQSENKEAKDISKIAIDLINNLLFSICSQKNISFQDENEMRMVLQDRKMDKLNNDVKFRAQGGVITPYIEVPIKDYYIQEIIIGPNLFPELSKKGLELLLRKYDIECEIKYTKCSLRQFR
jgi:hypothetical protein